MVWEVISIYWRDEGEGIQSVTAPDLAQIRRTETEYAGGLILVIKEGTEKTKNEAL